MATTSGVLGSYIYGYKTTPSLAFYEWDITEETSPVGYRNVSSGVISFVKTLGTSEALAMQFEDTVLDFSALEDTYAAQVQCFSFLNTETQYYVSNLRLWMPSGTALDTGGYIEYAASGTWIYNATLPSGAGNTMPTTLPTQGNIYNQNDETAILQGQLDTSVSQFVYLGLSVPSGMALGRYGVGGTGNMVFRVTYDWYNQVSPSYLTPEGYPNYPRNWSYPDSESISSGYHFWENDVWTTSPTANSGELLLAFITISNYNADNWIKPPEWTSLSEPDAIPDINSYYKFFDAKDASGLLYRWKANDYNNNDITSTIVRIIGGVAPSVSGYQTIASASMTADNMSITEKSLVVYYFAVPSFNSFASFPSDIIFAASGQFSGAEAVGATWALGYKNYANGNQVDGGWSWTSESSTWISMQRIIVPYR